MSKATFEPAYQPYSVEIQAGTVGHGAVLFSARAFGIYQDVMADAARVVRWLGNKDATLTVFSKSGKPISTSPTRSFFE